MVTQSGVWKRSYKGFRFFCSATLLSVFILTVAGCGSSGSGGGSSGGGSTGSTVAVNGTVDSSITLASSQSPSGIFSKIFPGLAYASGGSLVDNIVATNGQNFIKATLSGNAFSLSLPINSDYIIILLHGTSVVGIMQANPTTGMYSIPLTSSSTNVDVGTVSVSGTTNTGAPLATGTTSSSSLLSSIGISSPISSALGIYDVAMQQSSSMDVDGNGVLDFLENRTYHINVDYEFNETRNGTFAAIQGGATSDYTSAGYLGYEYYVSLRNPYPSFSSLNWSGAMMASPVTITTASDSTEYTQCYNSSSGSDQEELNFYCRTTNAVTPVTPPTGTYKITVPLTSGGNQVFTFNNVTSQTISSSLYNIYVPAVSITYSGGNITNITWQWWKRTPSGWVQPSTQELSTVMTNITYEIGLSGWPSTRVLGNLPIQSSGSMVPTAQKFTAAAFRISYTDVSQYTYGFEWD